MSQIVREQTETVRTTPVMTEADHLQEVTVDPFEPRRVAVYRAQQIIYFILAIIEIVIGIRFLLRLLAANPSAGFAIFIYDITAPLVIPFAGLFPTPVSRGSVFEVYSLVAMIIYALIFWLVAKFLWIAFGETRTGLVTKRVDTHRVEPPM